MGCGTSRPQPGSVPQSPSPTQAAPAEEGVGTVVKNPGTKEAELFHSGSPEEEDNSQRAGRDARSYSADATGTGKECTQEAIPKPLSKRISVLSSGVALDALLELGEQAAAWDPKATTRAVVDQFIVPATQQRGVTFLATLPKMSVGMPRYYVVHAWGGLFQDLVSAVRSKLRNRAPTECFVWLDFMAISQCGRQTLDLSFFQLCMQSCTGGTLVVQGRRPLDSSGIVFTRAWCLYELWLTLQTHSPRHILPRSDILKLQDWHSMIMALDIRNSRAASQEDVAAILHKVQSTVGGARRVNHDLRVLFTLDPLTFREDIRRLEPDQAQAALEKLDSWVALNVFSGGGAEKGGGKEGPCRRGALLWIRGAGGSGKSTLAATMVQRAVRAADAGAARHYVLLHHFIKTNDSRRQEALLLLRTLAYQLYQAFPHHLGGYYAALGPKGVAGLTDLQRAFRALLQKPISQLPNSPKIVILVDGLDGGLPLHLEDALSAQKSWANELLRLVCCTLGTLPPNVGLIVTSRPDTGRHAYLGEMLRRQQLMELTEVTVSQYWNDVRPQNYNAIASLLEERVSDASARHDALMDLNRHWAQNKAYLAAAHEVLKRQAELGAELVLPPSLYGAYQMLAEDVNSAEPALLAKLVNILVAAQEPLSLRQLHALGLPDLDAALHDIRFLFSVDSEDGGRLQPYHSSVLEFLVEEPHLAGALAADPQDGHRQLFNALCKELKERKEQATRYCLRNILLHGLLAEADQDKLDEVVSSMEFWQSCYDRGVGSTVAAGLLGMRDRSSPSFEDARRFLTSHHPELLANPDSLLQRIAESPEPSPLPCVSLRSAHNILSGLSDPPPGEDHWPAQRVAVGQQGTDALVVALSHDNALMATACWSDAAPDAPSVTFWDALDGHNLGELPSFPGRVTAMVFSPTGDTLAVAQAGKSVVLLFEPASGAELGALHGHGGGLLQSGTVNALSFSGLPVPVLASGSDDKMVRLWDVKEQKALVVLKGHTARITAVAISEDASIVVSGSVDKTVRLWGVHEGSVSTLHVLEGNTDRVCNVVLGSDFVASSGGDAVVRIWNRESGTLTTSIPKSGVALALSPCGRVLVGAALETGTGEQDSSFRRVLTRPATLMKHSTISSLLREFSDAIDDTSTKLQNRRNSQGRDQWAAQDALAAAATTAGASSPCHDLVLWDPSTGELRARLRGHTGPINSIVYSSDGSSIASCSTDGTTRLWQVECIKGLNSIGGAG